MKEIPKSYNPQEVEDKIYKTWEKSGFFNPDNLELPANKKNDPENKFVISMPPPNATGVLHLGHASMLAYQDLMIRYNRMKSKNALWLPGTDHAAIATQTKVEKIITEEGKTKYDLGREKFLERVNEYIKNSQDTIKNQTRKMGSSCDWNRERYTLDEGLSRAVKEVFVKMYNDGLIYRGDRIVNWCPRCESTLADDEVEHKDQKANLYYFKYDKNFPITIATTRPETKLGDTAVAVNPEDERYKKYIGQIFKIKNFASSVDLKIKIIADREIDMNFGTGALGVTPAHSMTDWEMAKKNDLEKIKIIGEDGKMNENAGANYQRLTVLEAREKFVKYLRENNLLEKVEEIDQALSVCYRCETPIEPLPSKQWFVAVDKKITIKRNKYFQNKSLKEVAIEVVKNEKIKIIPERFEKTYFHWMENLHDWCISRQLWFGHRIPVYYKLKTQNSKLKTDITYFVHGTTVDNENNIASGHHDTELSELGIQQSKGLKETIKKEKFDVIFCSDLKRAVDTANIVFKDRNIEIIQDKRLRECDYGDLTQTDAGEILTIEKEVIDKPFPNGESYKDVEIRIKDFLNEIVKKYPNKKIAIVAHKAPQLALDVILKNKSWQKAMDEDWRKTKSWQAGWKYEIKSEINNNEIYVGEKVPEEKYDKAILLHAWDSGPEEAFFPWLRTELESRGIKVIIPCLPNPKNPDFNEWLEEFKKIETDKKTIIVGRSLGATLALGAASMGKSFGNLVAVCTPLENTEIPEFFNQMKELNFTEIKNNITQYSVIHSSNDPYIKLETSEKLSRELNVELVVVKNADHFSGESYKEILKACDVWIQDPNTLDTWFSSGLWTFSTLLDQDHKKYKTFEDWIENSPDLKKFHPTSVMETGYDILFFWVARMILMTTYTLGEVPFENVYLHGMVRDKQGRKMSKSLGNGIDPIEMIEKYGTDALRLSIIVGSSPGNDLRLYEEKIEGYRNFVNKLWNISRYILLSIDEKNLSLDSNIDWKKQESFKESFSLFDIWILIKTQEIINKVSQKLDNYEFSAACEILKDFTWNEFADWYIEIAKIERSEYGSKKNRILIYVLKNLLKLWHPFIPFVTEKIWSEFGEGKLLMVEKLNKVDIIHAPNNVIFEAELIIKIIKAIRSVRAEYKIRPDKKINAVIYAGRKEEFVKSEIEVIKKMRTGIDKLEIKKSGEKIKNAVYLNVEGIEIYLTGIIDKEKEKERLEKEIANLKKYLQQIKRKLGDDNFVANAPREVVEKEREKYQINKEKMQKLKDKLKTNQ